MADDIKIKLGLDAGTLFTGLDQALKKVTTSVKSLPDIGKVLAADLPNASAKLNTFISDQKNLLVALKLQGKEGGDAYAEIERGVKEATAEVDKMKRAVKEVDASIGGIDDKKIGGLSDSFKGAFAGGLAGAGIGVAIQGVKALGSAIFDGAIRADEFGDQLEVAFKQQGVKDIQGEIEKVRASSLGLANDLGLPVERTRQLAATVAQLGGVTGAQAEGLTKLAAGIETFTDGTVKGEAVAKAFSRGLADPEGAAAIEALSKKYPQLAETLKSTLDPTEKLAEANRILGTSFETVKDQQSDAGGTFNKLSNSVSEAFESIGTKVYETLNTLIPILSGTLMPIFDFISTNLGTIGAIVGTVAGAFILYNSVLAITSGITALTTGISTAYAAVQVALGGSIGIATVAQYALNLAMSLNPIGAIIVVAAALVAGIYALSSALTISAADTREASEENVKLVESQKNANQEQTNAVKSTKALADEFLSLSKKKKLTADETAKLKGLTKDLSAEYPDLVKNTGSYKDNLDGVESIANRAGDSLKGLAEESAKLDNALREANQTLSYSKRNESIEQAVNATKNLVGYVTDPNAKKAIDEFATALYDTKSAGAAADVLNKVTKSGYLNAEQITAVTSAYTYQVQALDTNKKAVESLDTTRKKLAINDKPKGEAKEVATDLEKAIAEYQKYYLGLEVERTAYNLTLKGSEDEQKKLVEQRLKDDAKLQQEYLNKIFAKATGAEYQATLSIVANVNKGESENNVIKAYQDIFTKNKATLDKSSAIKPTVDKDAAKDVEDFYKKLAESIGEQTKGNATLIKEIIPEIGALTNQELQEVTGNITQLQGVIQGQLQALRDQLAAAQIAGADKAAELFQKQIDEQQKNLDALRLADENYRLKSQESIKKNTLEYQVQTALQTSFLDEFNSEKIRKDKLANDAIRKERLGALDSEEKDLNKSLAKREISAEEYAAKLADINKGREEVESKTNKSALDKFKKIGDQTAASVLKSQGDIFKKNAEKMEGNEKVFNEFVGNTLNQFSVLAASGTATLADFGAAAAGAAFDAVAAMIPSFVTGILGTSIITLGPILGPLAAASLTAVLYGLLGLARSASGFKDGVVGLDGGGTETSDSIPAWLSRGESVITARATKNNKEELEFMNRTGLSIGELYRINMPSTSVSVTPDGDLIREVRKLREETRGLGMRIQRNTNVEVSGVLTADSRSINAMIVQQKRREARR